MKIFLVLMLFSSVCFANDLEERVLSLEKKMSDLGNYVENNCELVYEFAGSSTIGCYDSFISHLRTDIRAIGPNLYVTNWMECRRYRLVCRNHILED